LKEDRRIRCDPQRFNQILLNLLTNAIKFTPRDGTVRTGAVAEDSECAVYVSDSGIGMDPASLPQMFQAYKQNGRSESKGLGLGLTIARRLAEAHGAKLDATSAGPGKGSTFWIRLPACGGAAHPSDEIAAPSDLRNSLILIALNEPKLSSQLQSEFSAKGAEVVLVSSGIEAVRLIVQRRPDLIVCNLDLQGPEQFEIIKNVRLLSVRDGGRTPAIALSPAIDQQTKALIMAAGYDICLPVNTTPTAVIDETTQVLENRA
jgi:CheY-like chemotaxis protein